MEIFQYFDRDSPFVRNLPPRQYSNEIFSSRMNLGTDLTRLMFRINKTFINILFALLHLKSYQFARKYMYVAFQCSCLFLLPSSTPSASRRILQKVRLPPLVSSRPSSFRYSSRILPSLFSCRHMSKFLRGSCFRIERFLREEDVN